MPIVAIRTRPCPGTCKSKATCPHWISQKCVAAVLEEPVPGRGWRSSHGR